MALTPAQRRAKLEAAKKLMQEVETDAPELTPETAPVAADPSPSSTKDTPAPATPKVPDEAVKNAAAIEALAPKPHRDLAEHADPDQPSVYETTMAVARHMKATMGNK